LVEQGHPAQPFLGGENAVEGSNRMASAKLYSLMKPRKGALNRLTAFFRCST